MQYLISYWVCCTMLFYYFRFRPAMVAHQPVATALCVGDRISRAKWVPENNCGNVRNVTELLKEIDNVRPTFLYFIVLLKLEFLRESIVLSILMKFLW